MSKPSKTKYNLDPRFRYIFNGIPQDNVIDLRRAPLAKKQAPVIVEKKEKIEEIKKKDTGPSFWQLYWESRRVKKEKKRQERLILIKEKQARQEAILEAKRQAKIQADLEKARAREEVRLLKQERENAKQAKKKERIKFHYSPSFVFKPIASFIIICLILSVPIVSLAFYKRISSLKDSVLSLSNKAFTDIKIGSELASELNFQEASIQFNNAFNEFNKAQGEINSFSQTASKAIEYIPGKGKEFKSAKNLLSAATNLSSAAEELTLAFDIFNKINWQTLNSVDSENPPDLTDIIVLGHSHLQPASEKIDLAIANLEDVDPEKLPAEYRDQIAFFKEELPAINNSLKQVIDLSETMLTILGHEQPKRYLVVFQNNRELRATGGFLGSFGLIDISKGQVTNINIPGGGTYDLNGQLKAKVATPEPLHLINPIWQIQDANWWPDWPTSAQKIEWFYNQSDGPTVDGVLSLTPDIIEDMLALTGPIDMTDPYGVIIDENNFYTIIQTEAEKKYDVTQTSKQIIADLTPKLLDRLFTLKTENALSVLQVFYNALREKQILLYFNDQLLESEMQKLGWSGEIKDANSDYLSVIDTNIGGGKTNALIEQIISHQATISADGSIEDTVSITYTHKGKAGEPLYGLINWDYLRVYVPEGSQLVSANGFTQPDKDLIQETPAGYTIDEDLKNISGTTLMEENYKMRINKEFGKTVFANWVKINPGETTTVSITYNLPKKLDVNRLLRNIDTYSLLVQKQPGSFDPLFYSKLTLPENLKVKWQYPTNYNNSWDAVLDTDKYIGVVVVKE
jgi:hypothetical protein